jgi:prepilin-type N-terminal cleavage/methylation domain-containing protein
MKKRLAFTLVEIMMVVLLIGLLLAIAVPQWIRARENAQGKSCVSTLRRIGDAKDMFAQENNIAEGGPVVMGDIWPDYIKGAAPPSCPSGGTYTLNNVGVNPECTIVAGLYPHILP